MKATFLQYLNLKFNDLNFKIVKKECIAIRNTSFWYSGIAILMSNMNKYH